MQTSQLASGVHSSELSRIAQDLQIRKVQVESVVQLLDEGNTVPFITRYRKERTGGLDEEKIRRIQTRVQELRNLNDRRATILKSIEAQGKLTPELQEAINGAESFKRLEDLYLPYKPKKKTLASDAREKGLEPLAQAIWNRDPAVTNLQEVLTGMINPEKGLNTPEDILTGVGYILAEQVAEVADLRAFIRGVVWDTGQLLAGKTDKVTPEKGAEYKDYFDFKESARLIPPHRILAVNRGEKEGFLTVAIRWDTHRARDAAISVLPFHDHPHRELLLKVLEDALERIVYPSMEREVRREQTEAAQDHAVAIFARNLRSLLLQPPLRGKRVLAIDPGFRTGCKLSALDETGNFLEETVIFPHDPQNKKTEAKEMMERFIRNHQCSVLAIGNGTACRETEALVSDLIQELEDRRTGKLPTRPIPQVPSIPEPQPVPQTPIIPDSQPVGGAVSGETPPSLPIDPSVASEFPTVDLPSTPSETPSERSPADTPTITLENVVGSETPPSSTTSESALIETSPIPSDTSPPVPTLVVEPPPVPNPVVETPKVTAPSPRVVVPPPPPLPYIDSLPLPPVDIAYVIVNEAGASDYSASQIAREEFPNLDATIRSTISIGRRLQDPLAELVKIDPQHVGVGLYQHDVKHKHLKESLEAIIESCVNHVGVDLNTASVPLLRHVSGLNQMVARDLVEYRNQHGSFHKREQLLQVNGIGPARYTQAAGFLKIISGEDPLDNTWIHPESYEIARQILSELGFSPNDLLDKGRLEELRGKLQSVNVEEVAHRLNAGVPTVKDIVDSLARPGRDPREDLPPPIFKKGILKLEDLSAGMELKGTVLNVVDFGAFVDIGLKDSGLVHISQMANRYIKSPYEVVAVGDVVTVWVMRVETDRRRVSLTMIPPGVERTKPTPRPPQQERPPRGDRPERTDQGDRGQRFGGRSQRSGGPPRETGTPRSGDRPPFRGGPPRDRGPRQNQGSQGTESQPPERKVPPPRKPAKPKPLPKLSQDALTGRKPLHTFGELEAFFKAKDTPEPIPTPEPPKTETPPTNPVPVETPLSESPSSEVTPPPTESSNEATSPTSTEPGATS